RLRAGTDRPVHVVNDGVGAADAVRADRGGGVQADPLAIRRAHDVHGELGVDEPPLHRVQATRDTVAGVGDRHQSLQRARLLTAHQRDPLTGPHRGRTGFAEPTLDRVPLHRVDVAGVPAFRAAELATGVRTG